MKKNRNNLYILTVVAGAIAGLIFGYLIFGTIAGQRVPLDAFFATSGGSLRAFANDVTGISEIRRNILLTGLAGALLGGVQGYFLTKNGKKRSSRKRK